MIDALLLFIYLLIVWNQISKSDKENRGFIWEFIVFVCWSPFIWAGWILVRFAIGIVLGF